VPKHIATWNSARSVWETDQGTLLCAHSVVWSATWPTSGTTRNGRAYERQMSVPRMSGIVLSSGLGDAARLPTPDTGAGKRGAAHPDRPRHMEDGRRSHAVTLNDAISPLLPSPDAGVFEGRPETTRARRERLKADPTVNNGNGFGLTIGHVASMLPTPTAKQGKNETAGRSPGATYREGRTLVDAVEQLPTPTAADGERSSSTYSRGNPTLSGATSGLLPTPMAHEADHGGSQHPDARAGHQVYLSDVIEQALMATPRATDGAKGGPNARGSAGDMMMPMIAAALLPTPRTSDINGPGEHGEGSIDLRTAISLLLPTPTAQHGNASNNRDEPLLPGLAERLPTPAARDWRSGKSNIMDRNARPLNEIVETAMRSSLLPTPTGSDGLAGNASRSGSRSGELLLAGVTRAMLHRISFGESATRTTAKRSARGKRSPDDPRLSPLFPIDAVTTD